MKVLVATKRSQGMREWDMCFALEGELVMRPPVSCDCPDCPCERDMIGLGSRSGTTTFTVANRPEINFGSYREILRDELVACGWVLNEPTDVWFAGFADRHLKQAAQFEVGTVLEIGDDRRVVRRPLPERSAGSENTGVRR